MRLRPQPAGQPSPVQRKPAPAAEPASDDLDARINARWLDTAMRPDLHPAPVDADFAPPPAGSELTDEEQSAARTILDAWRISRRVRATVDRDHIHYAGQNLGHPDEPDNPSPFIADRKKSIENRHGPGHLAEQYGLRAVKSLEPAGKPNEIRIAHPYTPAYQRDSHKETDTLFKKILEKNGFPPG